MLFTKQITNNTKIINAKIKKKPKNANNNAAAKLPATNEAIAVSAKKVVTRVPTVPTIKGLPYSDIHSFAPFLAENTAAINNSIKLIPANAVANIIGVKITSAGIVPLKNNIPITTPNITETTTGNKHTSLSLHISFQLLL